MSSSAAMGPLKNNTGCSVPQGNKTGDNTNDHDY